MAVRAWVGWFGVAFGVLAACSGKSGPSPDAPSDSSTAGKKPSGSGATPGSAVGGKPTFPEEEPSTGGEAVSVGGTASTNEAGAGPDSAGAAGAPVDLAGITVHTSATSNVHESYGTLQIQLVLTARPSTAVKVELSSSDPSHATVSPSALTFTSQNWASPQVALIVGETDLVADGAHQVTIATLPAISNDARYQGFDAADFEILVLDDTDVGITVGAQSGSVTTESGGTATFNIVLNSMPTGSVTIPLTSSDLTEGTVPQSVTFEPADWSEPQSVTVTGVDDNLLDGNQPYKIVLGAAVSTDASYAGIVPADVRLTNVDND